jgi:ABC-type uncharacterized transport system permease subunit
MMTASGPSAGPKSGPGPAIESRRARDRRLDRIDRLAAWLIRLGGLSIVLSVIAIILFIGAVALPLVRGAKATGPSCILAIP